MQFNYLYEKYDCQTLLKIDLDRHKLTWYCLKGIKLLSKYYPVKCIVFKRSPSKKWHIIIGLDTHLTDFEIVAWQFAIDSDKQRERYNMLRIINGNNMKDWNLLFPNKKHIKINFKEQKISDIDKSC